MEQVTQPAQRPSSSLPEAQESRPWAVKALTLLLFTQAAVLFGIAVYSFITLDLPPAVSPERLFAAILTTFTSSILFTALALLALLAAMAFLGLWRAGWSVAMLAQGLVLSVALIVHFRTADFYIYPLMVYTIFLVIYLYHPDVQDAFHIRAGATNVEESE